MNANFVFRGSVAVFNDFKGFVLWCVLITYVMSSVVGNANGCCGFNLFSHVCCNGECVFGTDCIGHRCTSDSHCAGMESCCHGVNKCKADYHCLGDVCRTNSDCGRYGSCCQFDDRTQERKCLENCLGARCTSDFDCGRNECCCGNKCSDSLCGSCARDADCGSHQRCCSGVCRETADGCINQTAIFCGAIGSVAFLCFLGFLYNCVWLRRRLPRYQDETHLTALGACAALKSSSPNPEQNLPPYEQACPDSPPPRYEQQERVGLQHHHRETPRTREAPPPYSESLEERSGGAYAAYPSYGAVLTTV